MEAKLGKYGQKEHNHKGVDEKYERGKSKSSTTRKTFVLCQCRELREVRGGGRKGKHVTREKLRK